MSDKIVVMKGGEIQQIGTPEEIYNEPANRYVANFIGESAILSRALCRRIIKYGSMTLRLTV